MLGAVIWYVTTFACAALFIFIGIYASKREKPMWFWAGSEVDTATITDVKAYNRENGRMWKLYSLWFWTAGIAWAWDAVLATVILVLGGTVGIGILISTYLKIEKKYKVS